MIGEFNIIKQYALQPKRAYATLPMKYKMSSSNRTHQVSANNFCKQTIMKCHNQKQPIKNSKSKYNWEYYDLQRSEQNPNTNPIFRSDHNISSPISNKKPFNNNQIGNSSKKALIQSKKALIHSEQETNQKLKSKNKHNICLTNKSKYDSHENKYVVSSNSYNKHGSNQPKLSSKPFMPVTIFKQRQTQYQYFLNDQSSAKRSLSLRSYRLANNLIKSENKLFQKVLSKNKYKNVNDNQINSNSNNQFNSSQYNQIKSSQNNQVNSISNNQLKKSTINCEQIATNKSFATNATAQRLKTQDLSVNNSKNMSKNQSSGFSFTKHRTNSNKQNEWPNIIKQGTSPKNIFSFKAQKVIKDKKNQMMFNSAKQQYMIQDKYSSRLNSSKVNLDLKNRKPIQKQQSLIQQVNTSLQLPDKQSSKLDMRPFLM